MELWAYLVNKTSFKFWQRGSRLLIQEKKTFQSNQDVINKDGFDEVIYMQRQVQECVQSPPKY